MLTLSVIIIVKNEARNIRRCLRSLAGLANEIIILDSGSTDNTVEICRQYTSHVFITDWPGYGPQKNRALRRAQGDWVLSLDADEWVTAPLRAEIQHAIQQTDVQGFYLPRLNMFCGRFQRHGDAARDKVLRLFQRNAGEFTNDIAHEKVICQGKIGYLQQRLLHNSSRTLTEWSAQMQNYTRLTAELRHAKGKRSNPLQAVLNGAWIFFRSYFLRQGYRDGRLGWLFAKLNAISSFQKNLQLWRLNRQSKS